MKYKYRTSYDNTWSGRSLCERETNEARKRARMVNQNDARLVVVSSFSFAPSNPEAPETHTSAFSES